MLGAYDRWEMRHVAAPTEIEGCHPIWVSLPFLKKGHVNQGKLHVNNRTFEALYIDVEWMDNEALIEVLRLAEDSLPIVVRKIPKQPGRCSSANYESDVKKLLSQPSVVLTLIDTAVTPLITSDNTPFYWARDCNDGIYLFMAHPAARDLQYPMVYQQTLQMQAQSIHLHLAWEGNECDHIVDFEAQGSILLRLNKTGTIDPIELPQFAAK